VTFLVPWSDAEIKAPNDDPAVLLDGVHSMQGRDFFSYHLFELAAMNNYDNIRISI